MHTGPLEARTGHGARVIDSCELPLGTGNQTWIHLQGQTVLLTTEPSISLAPDRQLLVRRLHGESDVTDLNPTPGKTVHSLVNFQSTLHWTGYQIASKYDSTFPGECAHTFLILCFSSSDALSLVSRLDIFCWSCELDTSAPGPSGSSSSAIAPWLVSSVKPSGKSGIFRCVCADCWI